MKSYIVVNTLIYSDLIVCNLQGIPENRHVIHESRLVVFAQHWYIPIHLHC